MMEDNVWKRDLEKSFGDWDFRREVGAKLRTGN